MEIGFKYLCLLLVLNMFFGIMYLHDKGFYGKTYDGIATENFAKFISWFNLIAGAICIVSLLTLKIYNLI